MIHPINATQANSRLTNHTSGINTEAGYDWLFYLRFLKTYVPSA